MSSKTLILGVLTLICLLCSRDTLALTRDQARANGLAWLVSAQSGDGSWVDSSGSQVTATATVDEALALSGITSGYVQGAGTSWLFNAKTPSNDGLARSIIALARGGQNVSVQVQQLLAARAVGQPAGAYAGWGAYPGFQMTAMDTALAFEAFTIAKHAEANNTISVLSSLQHIDGGWSYSDQAVAKSSLFPTAHTLRALAYYVINNPSSKASADSAVTAGVSWLIQHKKNDGGFAEDGDVTGSNDLTQPSQVLETAVVWSTLYALQQAGFAAATTGASGTSVTQAMSASETLLLKMQQANGSWAWDPLQTATVMRAWSTTTLADTNRSGLPDTVKTVLANSYNIVDLRTLPKGNGNPVPGVVAANNVPVSHTDGDVPTLPEWGAMLMAVLLLTSIILADRKRK